jgi:hypothetical protein
VDESAKISDSKDCETAHIGGEGSSLVLEPFDERRKTFERIGHPLRADAGLSAEDARREKRRERSVERPL